MSPRPIALRIPSQSGAHLSARLDVPAGPVRAYALFAHCFTCGKDIIAARTIASALTRRDIAVLRFDFTGLGGSGGDFASTDFSMNLGDLEAAAAYLRTEYDAPQLLIGHSLGGAAVLAVAKNVPEAKAVVTIGAPSDITHLTRRFAAHADELAAKGVAQIPLGGRPVPISQRFVDNLSAHDILAETSALNKALLVMHAPLDDEVAVDHAAALFGAAKHPKSYISLDSADHLLSDEQDATYAANVIAAWADRFLTPSAATHQDAEPSKGVLVQETAQGNYQNIIRTGRHRLIADEPQAIGGMDTGPAPYELLSAALGACTSITLRMYADRKKLPVDTISVEVTHEKRPAEGDGDAVDVFTRHIQIMGDLEPQAQARMLEIADRCPVHRTLERQATIVTVEEGMPDHDETSPR